MDAQTAVILASLSVSVVIAVSVPWITFRLALRQDRDRRLQEQRTQLYVDVLTEAHAECKWLERELADPKALERIPSPFHDLRLSPLERARLGARGTAFASGEVNQAFNKLMGYALEATLIRPRNEAERLVVRMRVGGALEELEQVVRRELNQ
jgi:hypothetical protein